MLVAFVCLDGLDGVVDVAEFGVGEGAVNEAFAGLAGGKDDASALGFGDDVVAPRGDVAVAEDAHLLNWRRDDGAPPIFAVSFLWIAGGEGGDGVLHEEGACETEPDAFVCLWEMVFAAGWHCECRDWRL